MPLLQVRDFPEDLYRDIARAARADHRSIAQETVVLVRSALGMKEDRVSRRSEVLQKISEYEMPDTRRFPDPAELVREDRER